MWQAFYFDKLNMLTEHYRRINASKDAVTERVPIAVISELSILTIGLCRTSYIMSIAHIYTTTTITAIIIIVIMTLYYVLHFFITLLLATYVFCTQPVAKREKDAASTEWYVDDAIVLGLCKLYIRIMRPCVLCEWGMHIS
jgi:hypothetical protein